MLANRHVFDVYLIEIDNRQLSGFVLRGQQFEQRVSSHLRNMISPASHWSALSLGRQ